MLRNTDEPTASLAELPAINSALHGYSASMSRHAACVDGHILRLLRID